MGLYPLETTGDNHWLQHVAEVRSRLEKERDFRALLYKKYRQGDNVVDRLDTALSVASAGLAASGVRVLTTIIAAPVAIGLQAGVIACWLLGAGGRFICRRLEAKARKDDQIRVLAVSKLNSITDRISTALTDDKISEEEFYLILSEVDKYNHMKALGIRNRAVCLITKKSSSYTSWETKRWWQPAPSCWKSSAKLETVTPLDKHLASLKKSAGWSNPFEQQTSLLSGSIKKKKSAGWLGPNELVQSQTRLWVYTHLHQPSRLFYNFLDVFSFTQSLK